MAESEKENNGSLKDNKHQRTEIEALKTVVSIIDKLLEGKPSHYFIPIRDRLVYYRERLEYLEKKAGDTFDWVNTEDFNQSWETESEENYIVEEATCDEDCSLDSADEMSNLFEVPKVVVFNQLCDVNNPNVMMSMKHQQMIDKGIFFCQTCSRN